MAGHPDDDYNRDILDIIPERFDADPDTYPARSGLRLRNWLILGGAVLAVGVAVAVGWRMFAGPGVNADGVPVITADQRPIKIRPDDRGGMQVPNQDKLVYGRLEQGDGDSKVERLLPPAEQPVPPPPAPSEAVAKPVPMVQEVMKPAPVPPPMAAPAPVPVPVPPPVAVKPVDARTCRSPRLRLRHPLRSSRLLRSRPSFHRRRHRLPHPPRHLFKVPPRPPPFPVGDIWCNWAL